MSYFKEAIKELMEQKKRQCSQGNKNCGQICIAESKKCRVEGDGVPDPNQPKTSTKDQKVENEKGEKALNKVGNQASVSTFGANVNELALARELAGGFENVDGFGDSAEENFNKSAEVIGDQEAGDRNRMGAEMAAATKEWAQSNGFTAPIKKVHWTARPGSLAAASGIENIDQRKNPSDVVIEFEDGKRLGVSAKSSTKSSKSLTFKNSGSGTVAKTFNNPKINEVVQQMSDKFASDNGIPDRGRKQFIRSNPELKTKADAEGTKVLSAARDELLNTFNGLSKEEAGRALKNAFLDTENQGLQYIKVTGRNNGNTTITDPLNNKVSKALDRSNLSFSPTGSGSIQVTDNETGEKLFKVRAKWESQKLASRSLKFDVS